MPNNNNNNVINDTYNLTRKQYTTHSNINTPRNMISDKGRLPHSQTHSLKILIPGQQREQHRKIKVRNEW